MNGLRIPRFTREGWYFVCVLLFVMGGAVARELNLLVVLSGMMIGPLVFHARMVSLALRRLHVMRRIPKRIHAGEPLHVRIGVLNGRHRLGAWLLQAQDKLTFQNGGGKPGGPTLVDVAIPLVEPSQETWVSYRAHLTQRGRYEFGPISLRTRFPLGLLECGRRYETRDSLIVCPRLGHLSPEWAKLTLGDPMGTQLPKSRQGLTEAEFYGLREWRPGDSPRWVHWRTSARISTLAVRQFEQRRQQSLTLLLDLWLSPQATDADRLRLELAISVAATAVSDLGRHGGAHLTLAIAGTHPDCWSGPASTAFVAEIIDRLATVDGGSDTLLDATQRLLPQWPSGTVGIVVSTRPPQYRRFEGLSAAKSEDQRRLARMAWIDVGSKELERYFRLAD